MGAAAIPLAIGAVTAGTTMSVMGSIQQGKQAEKLSKQRAAIDAQNAVFARKNAEEQARIKAEQGRRFLASQQAAFSASGVMLNAGSPLVIEAQTKTDLNRDIGYILDVGNQQSSNFMANASYEKAYGKTLKQNSYWNAATSGIMGLGSVAYMGYEGGLWGNGTGIGQGGSAAGTGTASRGWSTKNSFGSGLTRNF